MWTRAELKDRAKFAFKKLLEKCADQFTAGAFDRRRQWRRKCRFGYVISFRK